MTHPPFDLAAALRAAGGPPDGTAAGDGSTLPTEPALPFAELARIDLRTDDLEHVLTRVAELAKATMAGAEEVSVTLIDDRGATTPAFTGPMARTADERQYEHGGPCGHAAQTGKPVLVNDLAKEERWPEYRRAALDIGVVSSLSVPLPRQQAAKAAINSYSTTARAFDDNDLALAEAFAGYAAVAIANAQLYRATASQARQMEEAMASRAVIEQAKGIIMGQRGCSADEAFQILARASQHANRKLRDIATDIVAAAQRR
jgi:GAF domain-containing protein